ncbi:MAG: PAS domain-containing protein [Sneathiella sp.]|nr:PAS domain-containing protein [Sneathiella sp.]
MIISRLLNRQDNTDISPTILPSTSEKSWPAPDFELKAPSHKLALAYWEEARGENRLPSRRELDLRRLSSLLPKIVLLDVRRNPLDFVYRIIGNEALQNFNCNYTGVALSGIPGKGPGSKVFENLKSIVEASAPSARQVPYVGPNRDFIGIASLALPLGKDHETVDKIMIIVEFISLS